MTIDPIYPGGNICHVIPNKIGGSSTNTILIGVGAHKLDWDYRTMVDLPA